MVVIREELTALGRTPSGLFVTDLDGTLLRSDRTFAAADLAALRRLGECGVVRVLATGRSLFSFDKVRTPDLPLDYLVFSTGAGLAELPSGRIVRAESLDPAEVRRACEILRALGLDFMVQRPIPDTHAFGFHASGRPNPDFDRRIALYAQFAFPLDGDAAGFGPATQLVAIVPPDGAPEALPEVRRLLPELTVIRSTSPLDHRSTWIEIFPASVSKSRTTGWLADAARHPAGAHGLGRQRLQRPRPARLVRGTLRHRQRPARPARTLPGGRLARRGRGEPGRRPLARKAAHRAVTVGLESTMSTMKQRALSPAVALSEELGIGQSALCKAVGHGKLHTDEIGLKIDTK